jgi:hypothetical protein
MVSSPDSLSSIPTPAGARAPIFRLATVACAAVLAASGVRAADGDAAAPAAPAASAASSPVPAYVPVADDTRVQTLPARTRLGFENVRLPGSEDMGLVGLTELVSTGHDTWVGAGVYGAATGHRGGLFVPGLEVAWTPALSDNWALDIGLFAGGGGGHGAPVGGGLMLRPHVDLVWRGNGFYTGPTLSLVRVGGGDISSVQLGWAFEMSSEFRVRYADSGHGDEWDLPATGLGFDRIEAVVSRDVPRNGSPDLDLGTPVEPFELVGIRVEQTGDYATWGIEAAGGASGSVAGYAQALATVGLRWPLFDRRLDLYTHLAAGLGGGGGLDTGGGLLVKADLGAALRVTDTLGVGLEAGLVHAPQGHFDARTASVTLNWILDPVHGAPRESTTMEWVAGVEHYDAARKDGTTRPLDAVVLSIERFVTPWLYLTGQAHSAFAGGAGAYSVGVIGGGAQVPLSQRVRLGAEVVGGAAGGGGVDTGNGEIVQARGYVDFSLDRKIALRIGAGKVKSVHGGLDATMVDAELVFRFGVDRPR